MSDSCPENHLAHDNDNYPALNPQSAMPTQAETDEQLISLWFHGRSKHTQRAYGSDIDKFLKFVNKPFRHIILRDLQDFADHLIQNKLSDTTCLSGKGEKSENLHKSFYIIREAA